ncbi:hypothetical protein B1A99_25120 [Cohnella sp. CIP 111063]|nr:hypothetical protein B1A99_25120 [Cohnella sp. CIP 111063]
MPAVGGEPIALAGFHLENPAQATLIVLAFDVATENQEREKQLLALAADARTLIKARIQSANLDKYCS